MIVFEIERRDDVWYVQRGLLGGATPITHAGRPAVLGPGWVATRMGGAGAPDDLAQGPVTQAWLAVSDDPAATVSGGYFYHQQRRQPNPAARDTALQDALLAYCADLTGTPLPAARIG